jgi:hypothetical protein
MGDIIESLKINTVFPTTYYTSEEIASQPLPSPSKLLPFPLLTNQARTAQNEIVVANANKSELANILNNIYETYKNSTGGVRQNYTVSIPDPDNSFKPINITINNAIFAVPQAKKNTSNAGIYSYYVTFGTLLSIIYSKLLLYDKKNGNQVPLFKFDMNFKDLDNDTNYILRVPGGFSGDPSKCLVGLDESFLYPNITVPQSNWSGLLSRGAKWIVDDNPKIGRLANVYVSIGYIIDVLNSLPKEKDGSITLLSFLKEIINTIQSCLGNINSIVIKEDPHEGTIRFIENAPQAIFNTPKIDENGDEISEIPVRFNLYGVKPGAAKAEGSFVRNLSLEAEISNNLTTMIVAGAQINSNQLTVNATAFSQYNDGLKDRVLTERTNWNYTPPSSSVDYSNEKITELWNDKIAETFQTIYGDQTSWDTETLLSLKELTTQYLQLSVGNLTERKQISTPFFMPFKLGFDMDGMSGIRLWEKFLIDDTILPPAYGEDNIDLQVKAINHVINNASWITHIDAIPAPAIKTPEAIKRPPIQRSTVTQQQPSNQTNFIAEKGPAKSAAEKYLGRTMSDGEWNQLVRATFAEASPNQTERAYVMAVILNRTRTGKFGGFTISAVLYKENAFQAVTGTKRNNRRPSKNYIEGPNPLNEKSIYGAATDILLNVPKNIVYFTSANIKAYGPGTDSNQRNKLLARGGFQIGGTIFSS